MISNRIWQAATGLAFWGLTILAWSGTSAAQEYRADEFLNLDLSRAVLSPKPLGPAASFTAGPLDVTIDRGKGASQSSAELVIDPKTVSTSTVHSDRTPATRTALRPATFARTRVAHAPTDVRAERPAPHKPHTLVAIHGRNPIEAQARDTRVQVWPCRSGGICNWKR